MTWTWGGQTKLLTASLQNYCRTPGRGSASSKRGKNDAILMNTILTERRHKQPNSCSSFSSPMSSVDLPSMLDIFPLIAPSLLSATLGKPCVRKIHVQPEFCRKGGRVESPCQMGCGTSLVNKNHYWETKFASYFTIIYHDLHQNTI